MLLAVEKPRAKALLDKYFNTLAATGYVKRPVVKKFLIWLFLVQFVERIYELLTDDDYNKINELLINIFSDGGCLLPYMLLKKKITVGKPLYMGEFDLRITEDNMWRAAEDGETLRATE